MAAAPYPPPVDQLLQLGDVREDKEVRDYLALVQPANGESVLDSLPVSPDFNVIITARPPGSIPTSLQAGSYIIYMEQP